MKVAFTGGGSGGHVTPNIAIINELKKEENIEIFYIGSKDGIEKELIEKENIKYYGVSAGKLRRYLSKKNISDFFKVFKGIKEASKILKEEKPDVLFSKGGFVSVPIVIAASRNRIPIIIHESDITPGLANKISLPFATKICVSFPETMQKVNRKKAVLTGSPIREEIFKGDKEKGYKFTKFNKQKPVITIMGGSLGAEALNRSVRNILDNLLNNYQIVHLCGKGKIDETLLDRKGYNQYEYIYDELKDILAITDLVITRAGANSIFEFLLLRKPNILIPLSKKASRGDQILNAKSFERQGFSKVLLEEDLTDSSLKERIKEVMIDKIQYITSMEKSNIKNGTKVIKEIIIDTGKKSKIIAK